MRWAELRERGMGLSYITHKPHLFFFEGRWHCTSYRRLGWPARFIFDAYLNWRIAGQ